MDVAGGVAGGLAHFLSVYFFRVRSVSVAHRQCPSSALLSPMQAPPRPHGAAWARADPWGGAEDPAAHDPHVASKYVSSIEVRAADEEDQEHRLRCTFDSFAVEGTAELDQIGGILASADVRVSEDDLRDAICQALPAGTLGVSFDDLLLVYDFLTDHRADQAQAWMRWKGRGPRRRPQKRLDRRLEAVAGAVGGAVTRHATGVRQGNRVSFGTSPAPCATQ